MSKAEITNSTDLPIVETFHSIQGEGYWTGINAFFIRLAGCDVGCPWCDTKHSWNSRHHPLRTIASLVTEAQTADPAIVIITGGEPLMHPLTPLCQALRAVGLRVHLETSGAHPFSGLFDWVTLSPKPFKPPHPSSYLQASELKIVVASEADLAWAETQANQVPAYVRYYLQPEWTSPNSQALILAYILQHPRWRLSLQTHKLLGVR